MCPLDLLLISPCFQHRTDVFHDTKGSNRPFSYSTKEPGSSDILIHFYTQGSIEWRYSFDRNCVHSKILQIVMKYR